MSNKIVLAPGLVFDSEQFACEVSAAIGNRGGGKSNGCAVAVEQLLDAGVQVVVLDYVGIWFALRLEADGKTPSSYDVPILGGRHGDVELSAAAGSVVAEALAERSSSCILDLSLFSKGDRARFATDFAETFFRCKKQHRSPSLIVLEEAQRFVPQRVYKGQERMLGAFEEIAEVGRNFGIGLFLISQRPQKINKDVLNLADNLFAFRTIGKHERLALEEWVQEKGQDGQRDIGDSLPGLPTGTCYAWSPTRKIFGKFAFRLKSTYDSGATPVSAQKNVAPWALDLKELEAAMGKAAEEARKGTPSALVADVAKLRAQVTKLEKENARLRSAPAKVMKGPVPVKVPANLLKALEKAGAQTNSFWDDLVKREAPKIESIVGLIGECRVMLSEISKGTTAATWTESATAPRLERTTGRVSRSPAISSRKIDPDLDPEEWETVVISVGEMRVLIAIAQHDGLGGVTREQLTVLCGYKRSSRDTYLQRLKSAGLVESRGNVFFCTSKGEASLGPDYHPLPTGAALLEYWRSELSEGERKILDLAAERYPEGVGKDEVEAVTGYKRSSRDTYLQRLRSRQLVTVEGGQIRASDLLFGE